MRLFSQREQNILRRNIHIRKIAKSRKIPISQQLEFGGDNITLPGYQEIKIFEQEKFASCGPSILKTAFYYLAEKHNIDGGKKIDEQDFYQHSFFAKISVKFAGIPPKILIKGINKQLKKFQFPYFSVIKKSLTYQEIKQELRDGTLMIFSHMGNTHEHPHILRKKTPKKTTYDLHYFLLLAIDENNKQVCVADPFGKLQTFSIQEFRSRISLEKKYLKSRGGIYYAGAKTKVIPTRMAMLLRKYPNT